MSDYESAILAHLAAPRTCPVRTPTGFRPPYPSYTDRIDASTTRVVMAYFGVQWIGDNSVRAHCAVAALRRDLARAEGSPRVERARYVDQSGYETEIVIAYWDRAESFDRWFTEAGAEWTSPARRTDGVGFFVEVVRPKVRRYETLFSASDRLEGVARLNGSLSGDILEHGYWGAMRDRLPAAAADTLDPGGAPSLVREGHVVRVLPHDNACLIRSGQDWTDADGDERALPSYPRGRASPVGCR